MANFKINLLICYICIINLMVSNLVNSLAISNWQCPRFANCVQPSECSPDQVVKTYILPYPTPDDSIVCDLPGANGKGKRQGICCHPSDARTSSDYSEAPTSEMSDEESIMVRNARQDVPFPDVPNESGLEPWGPPLPHNKMSRSSELNILPDEFSFDDTVTQHIEPDSDDLDLLRKYRVAKANSQDDVQQVQDDFEQNQQDYYDPDYESYQLFTKYNKKYKKNSKKYQKYLEDMVDEADQKYNKKYQKNLEDMVDEADQKYSKKYRKYRESMVDEAVVGCIIQCVNKKNTMDMDYSHRTTYPSQTNYKRSAYFNSNYMPNLPNSRMY